MKRIITVLLILVFTFTFAGCAKQVSQNLEPTTMSAVGDKECTKSIADIYMDIVGLVKSEDFLEVDSARISELYDIDSTLVKETYIATFTVPDAAFPGQIVLVEAVDEAAAELIVEKLNAKLADIKTQAESYDPVSAKLAAECEVLSSNNKVALFFTDKYDEMAKAFFG